MACLVIGSNGYLGTSLIKELSRHMHTIPFDLPQSFLEITPKWLLDNRIKLIINTAYLPVQKNLSIEEFTSNMLLPLHLAKTLRKLSHDIPLIQFSTREVIGSTLQIEEITIQPDGTFYPKIFYNEQFPLEPRNLYGYSKLIAEEIIKTYKFGVVIRLSTPYTDLISDKKGGLVSKLCFNSKNIGEVKLAKGGYQVRDPLHINDIATLILKMSERNLAQLPKTYCAGGGVGNLISLREICKIANNKVEIIEISGGDFGFAFDNTLVSQTFNWIPITHVRDKIVDLIEIN